MQINVEQRIKELATEIGLEVLRSVFGARVEKPKRGRPAKRNISAEGRAAISQAQQRRWAKFRARKAKAKAQPSKG